MIDSDKLSEYFLMENVKDQTMSIYEKLLGLTFSKIPDHKSWHADVRYYEVRDTQSMDILGHFYLDLHPRKDKYNHAAVFALIKRSKIDTKIRTPTVAMVTNFKKSSPGKPSLISHGDMVTFFHEFGHIMHHMSTESNYNRFSGTSVERDFVEMPS
jgi:Zn-dependent oligopeptidase